MSGPVFNQNVSGDNNQNIQGMDVSGITQNNTSSEPVTVKEIVKVINESPDMPEEVTKDIMPVIDGLSQLPAEEQEAIVQCSAEIPPVIQVAGHGGKDAAKKLHINKHFKKWSDLIMKLKPHAGLIWKNVATFGEASLKALASTNPIVSGVLAVCEMNSTEDE